jgi:hypothetical protein
MYPDDIDDINNGKNGCIFIGKKKMAKTEWVKNYTTQVLQQWSCWAGSLKISDSHVKRLENRLDGFFETTEKKVWIELIF